MRITTLIINFLSPIIFSLCFVQVQIKLCLARKFHQHPETSPKCLEVQWLPLMRFNNHDSILIQQKEKLMKEVNDQQCT